MQSSVIDIRPIHSPQAASEVEQVEAAAWDIQGTSTVPRHVLVAVYKNGGLLLGAYDGDRLVGYVLGWLGMTHSGADKPDAAAGRLKLVSHQMGVLPSYRDRNIGFRLKLAQREWALERSLDLITWTYDPLQGRNANLNIHRLGGICRTYLRDVYGAMSDGINLGMATDRFEVAWWLGSPHVRIRLSAPERVAARAASLEAADAQLIINPAQNPGGEAPRPCEHPAPPIAPRVLVEVPADLAAVRATDPGLGTAWRLHTRAVFEEAFDRGFTVVDFVHVRGPGAGRNFYVLDSTPLEQTLRPVSAGRVSGGDL